MASLNARLTRIERASRIAADAQNGDEVRQQIAALLLLDQPEMARVRPDQTDPVTYLRIQIRLAHARGDHAEARRLESLDPDRYRPPPPGTPPEECERLAREALDRAFEDAGDRTERVRQAVEFANRTRSNQEKPLPSAAC